VCVVALASSRVPQKFCLHEATAALRPKWRCKTPRGCLDLKSPRILVVSRCEPSSRNGARAARTRDDCALASPACSSAAGARACRAVALAYQSPPSSSCWTMAMPLRGPRANGARRDSRAERCETETCWCLVAARFAGACNSARCR